MSYGMDEGAEVLDFDPETVKVDLPPEHERYELCVMSFKSTKSSKGHPMLVLDVRGTEESRAEGTIFLPYSAKTLWKFRAVLGAVGVEEKRSYAEGDFVGKLLSAKVRHDEYQGIPRCEFYEFEAPAKGAGARAFEYGASQPTAADDDIPF